jgi:hypothetical protein
MPLNTASIKEIKSELQALDADVLQSICLRLAKYKKENKELMNYLLFEANDEQSYIDRLKEEIETQFGDLPTGNVYYIKKNLRKILRFVNRQIKYSAIKKTELEVRIYFCTQVKKAKVPLRSNVVLNNLYQQQIKKINALLGALPEDLQADYERELSIIL